MKTSACSEKMEENLNFVESSLRFVDVVGGESTVITVPGLFLEEEKMDPKMLNIGQSVNIKRSDGKRRGSFIHSIVLS